MHYGSREEMIAKMFSQAKKNGGKVEYKQYSNGSAYELRDSKGHLISVVRNNGVQHEYVDYQNKKIHSANVLPGEQAKYTSIEDMESGDVAYDQDGNGLVGLNEIFKKGF